MKETLCECLYFSASKLSRVITKMAEEEFKVVGVSPTYAFLLKTVGKTPDIGTCQIADELNISPSTITRFVDKLESKGLVIREFEGRCSKISLTEEGSKLLPVIDEAWKRLHLRYVDILGEDLAKEATININDIANKLLAE